MVSKILIFSFLFLFPVSLFSQGITTPENILQVLSVETTPENPKAGEEVRIVVKSFATDITTANFIWLKNNKKVQEGKGLNEFVFINGPVGSKTDISVSIQTPLGIPLGTTLSFRPAGVRILWESDGYTPPWFQGKSRHVIENRLTAVAVPNFILNETIIPSEDLVYTWTVRNAKERPFVSGLNRSSINFETDFIDDETEITVRVTHPASGLFATETIVVTETSAQVFFYELHPLFGTITSRAVSENFLLNPDEATILAVPFFMDRRSVEGEGESGWSISGSTEEVPGRSIVVRKPESGAGSATALFSFKSGLLSFQHIEKALNIRYGN